MRTVLVTAAGGNAGRNTVESLLNKGFNVVATARDPKNLKLSRDVETRAYDANNTTTDFDTLFKDINDVVLIGPPLDGEVHKNSGRLLTPQQIVTSAILPTCPEIISRHSRGKVW